MAIKVTLDEAPLPRGTLESLGTFLLVGAALGPVGLFFLIVLPWALLGLAVPPLAMDRVFAASGVERWGVPAWLPWVTAMLLGMLFFLYALALERRWRASHNRRAMHDMAAALRRRRRAGGWLIHREKLGILNLAAGFALIPALAAVRRIWEVTEVAGIGLPWLGLGSLFLLLANGARLLLSDVPLLRLVASAGGRILIFWLPFLLVMATATMVFAGLLTGGDGRAAGQAGMAVLIVGGIAAYWLGRRLDRRFGARLFAASLPKAGEAMTGDRRGPILYLRSFGDDDAAARLEGDDDRAWTRIEDLLA